MQSSSAKVRAEPGWFPVDLAETDESFVVRASLPGIRPQDVSITVLGDTVAIGAGRAEQPQAQANGAVRPEGLPAALYRSAKECLAFPRPSAARCRRAR